MSPAPLRVVSGVESGLTDRFETLIKVRWVSDSRLHDRVERGVTSAVWDGAKRPRKGVEGPVPSARGYVCSRMTADNPPSDGEVGSSISVLYVAADPNTATRTATALESIDDGLDVETALGGDRGLERVRSDGIDCVVSGHSPPEFDGIGFLETVREWAPELPVVLYTEDGSESIAGDAVEVGVTGYLPAGRDTETHETLARRVRSAVEDGGAGEEGHRRRGKASQQRDIPVRQLAENVREMVWISDLEESELRYVNSAFEEIWGRPVESLYDDREAFLEAIHPEDRERVRNALSEQIEGTYDEEYRIVRPDGEVRWVWDRAFPVENTAGEADRIVGITSDITDRKKRERELKEYENVLKAAGDAVYTLDLDGRFRMVNDRFTELTGYDRSELLGNGVSIYLGEADIRRGNELIRELLTTRTNVVHLSETIHTADGREIPAEARITLLEDESGDPFATTGVVRDVSDRRERERELERYEAVFEQLNDGIYVLDGDDRLIYVNDRYASMKKVPREELLGTHITEWVSETVVERAGEIREGIREGARDSGTIETTLEDADGRETPIELRLINVERDGHTERIGVVRDITERKGREQELKRQNARLEEFASVVSHDLRNPLRVAEGRVELAGEECDSVHLEAAERAHDRMDTLIEDLLALAREGEAVTDFESVELGSVVGRSWSNVETGDAELQVEIDRSVRADESRLKQVFENLFRNSVEHASTSNRLQADDSVEHGSTSSRMKSDDSVEHASTSNRPQADDSVEHGRSRDGDAVSCDEENSGTEFPNRSTDGRDLLVTIGELADGFYVADDGPGIPAENREDVFDLGYSTNADGTGFGLSIVERIVDAHGWEIAVTESADGGARFEITGVEFDDR